MSVPNFLSHLRQPIRSAWRPLQCFGVQMRNMVMDQGARVCSVARSQIAPRPKRNAHVQYCADTIALLCEPYTRTGKVAAVLSLMFLTLELWLFSFGSSGSVVFLSLKRLTIVLFLVTGILLSIDTEPDPFERAEDRLLDNRSIVVLRKFERFAARSAVVLGPLVWCMAWFMVVHLLFFVLLPVVTFTLSLGAAQVLLAVVRCLVLFLVLCIWGSYADKGLRNSVWQPFALLFEALGLKTLLKSIGDMKP